jgi:hypothetical protein
MGQVVVEIVGDELKASVACGVLASEGIHCYSRAAAGLNLEVAGTVAAGAWIPQEIVVNDDDAQRAKELLDAARDA